MGCVPLVLDGQVVGIMCGVKRRECTSPGCRRPAEYLCDEPLRGKRAGKTCSRGVCSAHRVELAPGNDRCTVHGKRARPMTIRVHVSFDGEQPEDQKAAIAAARLALADFAKPPEELKPLGWRVASAVRLATHNREAAPARPWSLTFEKTDPTPAPSDASPTTSSDTEGREQ